MKSIRILLAAGIVAFTAGCATQGGVDAGEAPVEGREATTGAAEGARAGGVAPGAGYTEADLNDPSSPLSQRVFYFDYDSSEIKPEFAAALQAHGQYLAAHPEERATIEGHTDERGSQEYNLALGERRADAVRRVLLLNGATGEQLEIVSFGEEKPAVQGGGESAWSQNRRGVIVYR